MAIHSSIFAWRIPWTEEPTWWAIVRGVAKSQLKLLSMQSEAQSINNFLFQTIQADYQKNYPAKS